MKSPLCKADRGRSICSPDSDLSTSNAGDRLDCNISGDGSKVEAFGELGESLRGVLSKSWRKDSNYFSDVSIDILERACCRDLNIRFGLATRLEIRHSSVVV